MMHRQHGTAQASFRMSSAMAVSCFSHSSTSCSYLSRVYFATAFLAVSSSASRSFLSFSAFPAMTSSAVCLAIRSSRQFGFELGGVGHLQQGSGSGHFGGGCRTGGVVVGSFSHSHPGGFG